MRKTKTNPNMTRNGMNPRVDSYFSKARKWHEEFRKLREIILNFGLTEEFKWGYPAYYYNGKRICILGGFKEHANIELFYGAHLKDTQGRIAGAGKSTRHIKLRTLEEVDSAYFVDLLSQSIALSEAATST